MANKEFFVSQGGPGSAALLRVVLLETDQLGTFQMSFEEASLDGATYPSLPASIVAATSKIDGSGNRCVVSTNAATETLSVLDSNRITVCTRTSTTQVFTLPVAAIGLAFQFVTTSAASEVLLNPGNGTDVFQIKATNDGASVVTAAGVGIKNTAATNVVGDSIWIVGVVGMWISLSQSGIWASQ